MVNEDYYRELLHLVKELGMERFVSFGGYSNDVFSLFGTHHALIMCSRNEAFGRVTLESLLAGRPVIGADSGGTSEMITNGQNGLLYRAGEAGDLCQRMIDLSNEYPMFDSRAISEAARKKFNRGNTLKQLEEIFK
ncbi:MAG: glycosyltransferase [Chitinophagaceae bacterium]|nr:glycosyltransferase [Chitinophagaceae bacterium]